MVVVAGDRENDAVTDGSPPDSCTIIVTACVSDTPPSVLTASVTVHVATCSNAYVRLAAVLVCIVVEPRLTVHVYPVMLQFSATD